jgi:hypothetical protein
MDPLPTSRPAAFTDMCGDEEMTRGTPSEWVCCDLISASSYRKNFSASMVRPLLTKNQAMPMARYFRISVRRAQQ